MTEATSTLTQGAENCIGNTAHASWNCFLTQSRKDAKNCMDWGELGRGAGVIGGGMSDVDGLEGGGPQISQIGADFVRAMPQAGRRGQTYGRVEQSP